MSVLRKENGEVLRAEQGAGGNFLALGFTTLRKPLFQSGFTSLKLTTLLERNSPKNLHLT